MASDSPRQVAWIFHGEGARFASGAFVSEEQAMEWIGRHRLTGILTEYPLGVGAYDDAVERGLFRPSRDHHGTPEHVGQFSPGRTRHVHVFEGREGFPDE